MTRSLIISFLTGWGVGLCVVAVGQPSLDHRCFVWAKEHCVADHVRADQAFVKSMTQKGTRADMAVEVAKRGWISLRDNADPENALRRFNQSLLLNESLAEAWRGAGESYLALGRPEMAEKLLLKSNSLEANRGETLAALGEIHYTRKQYSEAEKWLELAAKNGFSSPYFFNKLSRVKFSLKKKEEAQTFYRRARKLGLKADSDYAKNIDTLP